MKQVNKTSEAVRPRIEDHLSGKSQATLDLYQCLINELAAIGLVEAHAAKSMICLSAGRNFAYVIQLGRNFIDVVIPFKVAYHDNLCFRKINPVPGSDDFNHHLRIYSKEDFNDEVKAYLSKAYQLAIKSQTTD